MTAQSSNQLCTLRNPTSRQLGCNPFRIERDSPMLDLPAALALGKNRVARAWIAVFRQARRSDVHEQLSPPHPNVRKVKVAERDRRCGLVPDQALQDGFVGIRP